MNALDERALVREMASRRIGQTICPISNRYVVADSRSRDIKRMLDEGMRLFAFEVGVRSVRVRG